MNALSKLAELFSEFPGIGPRQAKRFVYFLLTKDPAYVRELIKTIEEIKRNVHICSSCFRFFNDERNVGTCDICRDPNRDQSILAVVSRDSDLEHLEKSHAFRGLYFVLGGTIPILEKEPERKVRIAELVKTVKNRPTIKEVILALSLNVEGEHTGDVVRTTLKPLQEAQSFKITVLGRGLSTGTELEYSDAETLKNAFGNRRDS